MGGCRHPQDRSRFQPFGRYPPDPDGSARACRHRPVFQGRVQPPHRQPQASPGALAVPVCAGQRLAARGTPGDRGLQRLHGGVRGVFRAAAGPAVHRGDAGHHLTGEDRRDRVPWRPLPPGRACLRSELRFGKAGARHRRPLHGPVHLRRAGHRLARQQQHCRVHLQADGRRAAPGAGMDRVQPGYRRHRGHAGPLRELPPARHPHPVRGPGSVGVLRRLLRGPGRAAVA